MLEATAQCAGAGAGSDLADAYPATLCLTSKSLSCVVPLRASIVLWQQLPPRIVF